MSVDKAQWRILQLDGLRGLAILLVICNHLRLQPLYDVLPQFFRTIFTGINGSGQVGVSILFLLSGFLMTTLYPQVTSKMDFWQKRYTRIFPALVAMSLALAVIRFFWLDLSISQTFFILLACLVGGGLLWKIIQLAPFRIQLGKLIFVAFLMLQGAVALYYIFILTRTPSAVFYIDWLPTTRQIIYFFVNSTLTLPLGRYVPQLDGVYWSLITEVFFYLLYPVLFLPIVIAFKNRQSRYGQYLMLALLFPFFYGLSLIFKAYLGLQMMQIHLAIYFVIGMLVGLYPQAAVIKKIQNFSQKIPTIPLIVVCLFSLIGLPMVRNILQLGRTADQLMWSIPLTFMFITTVSTENGWSRWLKNPIFVWLGGISYALYLTHSIAIETFAKNNDPQTLTQMLYVGLPAILAMGLLSMVLHYFLELPYFNKAKALVSSSTSTTQQSPNRIFLLTTTTTLAITLTLIWLAFRSPNSLASQAINHHHSEVAAIQPLNTTPLVLPFTATQNNLGMLTISVKSLENDELKKFGLHRGDDTLGALVMRLTDEKGIQLGESHFELHQIFESRFHPFGFPVQTDSQGKKYTLTLFTTAPNQLQIVGMLNKGVSLRSIYFFDKKELLKNPLKLIQLLVTKILQPFTEKEVLVVIILITPLLAGLLLFGLQPKNVKK